MADGLQTGQDLLREDAVAAAPPPPASGASLPIPKDPGMVSHLNALFRAIFTPYYNKFRLAGYLAQTQYSGVLRSVTEWIKRGRWADKLNEKCLIHEDDFHPRFFKPDWHDVPRMILNVGEAVMFFVPAVFDNIRERREMRQNVADVVAAEYGKDKTELSAAEIRHSENPLIQTQVNRYRTLSMVRYFQPLTFLYGLRLGITTTVVQIIAERSAFFEKNAYEQLQRVIKGVGNNEWGSWSHDTLVSHLVQIIQQNRAEHRAAPISAQEMEQFIPLLGKVAKHVMNKDWRLPETLYVLGELVKDPGQPAKVWQALEQVETLGLTGIAQQRKHGIVLPPVAVPAASQSHPVASAAPSEPAPSVPGFVKEIMARGPKPSSPEMMKAELENSGMATAQR